MKNLILRAALVLAVLGANSAEAQESNFNFVNVGVGVSGYGIPIYAGIDYTVADRITVGAMLGMQWGIQWGGPWWGGNREFRSIYGLGLNANYHFLDPGDEFDLYAGLSTGYNVARRRIFDGPGASTRRGEGWPFVGLQVGGRVRLDNGIILHGEIGGNWNFTSALRVGVSFPI